VATEAYVIEQVRRKVADFKEPRTYEKSFYSDAVTLALGQFNTDYGETYSSITEVPTNQVYLVVLLASIDMCYIRASEAFDSDESDDGSANLDISQLSVPDLSISAPAESIKKGGVNWIELAQQYQNKYDVALENSGGQSNTATIQVGVLRRVSKTHGGYANRKLDPGPTAVTAYASVSGSTVTISWNVLLVNDFGSYEVYRDTQSDMSTEERITVIVDNHIDEYDDEIEIAGTYYYRVKTVNPNQLEAESNIVSAVVA